MIRRPRRSPLFPYTTLFRSLLRYERREQQFRSDARFCHDLGIVAVILGGHPEAHARVPDPPAPDEIYGPWQWHKDRKSTRLNSSHLVISYAVFCLKKKNNHE